VKTVKTREEKQNQNKYFFWYKRENQDWIRQRLTKANRPDLIEKLVGQEKPAARKAPSWLEEKRRKR
jgi:hypothetical protein